MIKKILDKIKRFKANCEPTYIAYCDLPIDDKLVFLEGGQGENLNGNMFAMLKEIKKNPRWKEYKCVYTVTNNTIEKARDRMRFYGFDDVVLTVRNSQSYQKYLATAKYLMTDNSLPIYYIKREGQVYMNTWHGTPLKTLGFSNKSSLGSVTNIQKNYMMSDYALFPNEYTKRIFMDDYDLKGVFNGKSVISNYPRNSVFYDSVVGAEMKKHLGYEGKNVFAYMPTWRDAKSKDEQLAEIDNMEAMLEELDTYLEDSTIILVNLHFLLASGIDCSKFKHIKYFPSEYETYEVLNACDGLITDYSSVFFDFAISGKKIVLFTYDKEKYLSTRGTYMPFDELPFPIVETVSSLANELKKDFVLSQNFIDEYCVNGSKDTCTKLFQLMVEGETDGVAIEDCSDKGKPKCLIYAGGLPMSYIPVIKNYILENPQYDYIISYRRKLNQNKIATLKECGDNVYTLGMARFFQMRFSEVLYVFLFVLFGWFKNSEQLNNFFEREAKRLFYKIKPDVVVDFSNMNVFSSGILSKFSCEKFYVLHSDYFCVSERAKKKNKNSRRFEIECGFKEIDYVKKETEIFLDENQTDVAHSSYRKNSSMKNFIPLFFNKGDKMICFSWFKLKTPIKTKLCDTNIEIANVDYKPHYIAFTKKNSYNHRGFYWISVPLADVVELPAINKVFLVYKNPLDYKVKCHIVYSSFIGRFLGLRGPMKIYEETQTVAIYRQSKGNRLNIYVRSINYSDSIKERIKQILAFAVSLIWRTKKSKSIILLYEKNASKYEESASVLYEKLIDLGYKNTYFILTRDYDFIDRVPEKYRDNLIYKFTFKHYLYFFKSHTFIGTETITHAIDLKTFNIFALMKVASKNINYIFLQHGVMYMVSLDSEARAMFKRQKLKGKYRVIVSSELEANHFTTLGKHLPEDIYVTGLPKFDRNTHNDTADKIIIMPTWRPWEINEARKDFTETPYFKMLMKIYNSVPDELKEKVVILPHPLIVNELSKMSDSIADKIVFDVRYDDVLKDARLLITDYSSIAYDAFYRGARVIFYWEEKDYCMEQYGPTTKLMLNEENVYGDYFYSDEGLSEAIKRNYVEPQREDYIEKYRKIVEFHDGKNTDRLVEFLKQDGII